MKLKEVRGILGAELTCRGSYPDCGERDVRFCRASDLMSDVIANAKQGDLWITLQIHQNIVAVAVMKSISAIILVNSREPEAETVQKAEAEKVPIMISSLPAFELAGRLFELGLRGT